MKSLVLLNVSAFYVLLSVLCVESVFAQNSQMSIKVQDTFKPTFHVEPLVQRYSGRRGEVIPFRFKVESSSRDADLEILPIMLRQDLDGKVLHVEGNADQQILQLSTQGRVRIQRDTPYFIEGLVKVPSGNTDFYSLGIMIREIGQEDPLANSNTKANETKAGIRFVTQYIVRVDLNVEGVPGEAATSLKINEVRLAAVDGLPKLIAIVSNDTQSAFEFSMNARLYNSPSDRSFKRLSLAMPVRESLTDDSRTIGRLFPKSAVRMGSLVEQAVPSGEYKVDIELIVNNRIIQRKTFPVVVNSLDFPAQEVKTAMVGDRLYLSPGQVELSQARGGQRRATLEFINSSDKAQTLTLEAIDGDGNRINDMMIQPTSFTLAPNSRRKISATLRSNRESPVKFIYGKIDVASRIDKEDFDRKGEVPLAILFDKLPPAKMRLDTLRWVHDADKPGFRTTLYNEGESHHPVEAKLVILSEAGQRWTMMAGFGRWIKPNSELELDFPLLQQLGPGNYEIYCEVYADGEPVKTRQLIQVGNEAVSGKLIKNGQ